MTGPRVAAPLRLFVVALAVSALTARPLFAAGASVFQSGTPESISAFIDSTVAAGRADKPTIAAMTKALGDDTAPIKVRERCAWALGMLRAKSATPALIKAAGHKGLLIRSAALGALAEIRPATALSAVTAIAESDPILNMRRRATLTLGLLQSDQAIPTLVKLATDPQPEVRGAVAYAMAALQSKKNDFTQALEQMKGDPDSFVQTSAQTALAVAQRDHAAVRAQLGAADTDTRLFAALFFHVQGQDADLPALKTAWNGETDPDVKSELESAIKATRKRVAQAERAKKRREAQRKKAAAAAAAKSKPKPKPPTP